MDGRRDVTLTTWHPLSEDVDTNFADKRWSLDRYISLSRTQATEYFLFIRKKARCYIYVHIVEVEVNLRPTVSRPVCLDVRNPSETRDQFYFLLEISFR
jgi:hypothetical protein